MTEATLISHEGKLTREQLALVPTPLGTSTHKPGLRLSSRGLRKYDVQWRVPPGTGQAFEELLAVECALCRHRSNAAKL
jgi:hypothetical protein